MATAKVSKYDVDPQLFRPEPPIDPRQVKKLFFGREAEFRRGLHGLKAGLDVGGKRYAKFDKPSWVIHGESRSGKSHLARRIFAELPDNDQRLQFRILAGGRLEAITVMRELFEEFRGRFLDRIFDQRLKNDPLRSGQTRFVKQLVEKIAMFEPGTQSVTLTSEESSKEAVEAGLEIGCGTLLGKFIGKFQAERAEKGTVQLALRQPTAADLAEVCGIMAETLLSQKLIQHVLVLMDNVDLLEEYVSAEQNARKQRFLLADAIRILHSAPAVDVVITARSWYAHSSKELHTLVKLESPMPPEELLAVHDLRVKAYGRKHAPAEFLTRDALGQLAGDINGLPGVFLQHLQTAFYQFQNEDDLLPREYAWLLDFVRRHLNLIRERCTPGYEALEKAVNEGRLTVDISAGNPFFGTMLDNEYAYQSYYSETAYFISPLVRRVMAEKFGVGS